MDKLKEFLQNEDYIAEGRKYRNQIKERSEIDSILQDIEREKRIEKENFKNILKNIGVNLTEGKEKYENSKNKCI